MGQNSKRGNKHTKSKIEKLEAIYKKKYDSWKKTFCPSLKADVLFTNEGWEHLYVRKKRSSIQLEDRYAFLPHAKKIIEATTTTVRGDGWKDKFHMYNLIGEYGGVKIRVDISKTKKGYIFFSHHREGP